MLPAYLFGVVGVLGLLAQLCFVLCPLDDEAFPEIDRFPAALYRGGHCGDGEEAGVLALDANDSPSHSRFNTGFRCAR